MSKSKEKLLAVIGKMNDWILPALIFVAFNNGVGTLFGKSVGGVIAGTAFSVFATYTLCKGVTDRKRQEGRDESRALIARLEKERDQLRKKENESHSLITNLQKTVEQQQKRTDKDHSLITHLQKAEKIKKAKETGDRLAIKSAILDQASTPEQKKREATINRLAKTGTPLSKINVQRLRDQEEKKRLKVNKELLQNKQGR